VKVVFMPKDFNFWEVIRCCSKIFNAKHKLVNMKEEGKILIPLTLITFRRMLQLLEPTKIFKVVEADAFLDAHEGGGTMSKEWIFHPTMEGSRAYQREIT
jgi:hypothetical protein